MSKVKLENIRELPRKIAIILILLVAIITLGTVCFKFILDVSFERAFITTLETFSFSYHPTSGLARALGMFLSIFGVVLIWWALWSVFDLLYEGNLREYLKVSGYLNKISKMKNHYIIAGGGRVGEDIATHFSKTSKNFVIIEKDEATLDKLKKLDLFVMHGDVSDESVLNRANIKQAKAIVLAMPETEKNLLMTLMAKEMNPGIDVYARADKPAFVSKLKKAGAKIVVVPEIVAAERLFESID